MLPRSLPADMMHKNKTDQEPQMISVFESNQVDKSISNELMNESLDTVDQNIQSGEDIQEED